MRLHQPALTYGLNSRELGVGGADLASKSQILSHFEMGLSDLLATGRVRFLSQCRWHDDDLDNDDEWHTPGMLEMARWCPCWMRQWPIKWYVIIMMSASQKLTLCQIKYRKKLVDATCCETIVPATSPPGFKVAPGVNFMPINGKYLLQKTSVITSHNNVNT